MAILFLMLLLVKTFGFNNAQPFIVDPVNPDITVIDTPVDTSQKSKIQLALLLDTSNSMDGLIDQAKSQLWKMVNELATAKKDGVSPDIELAIYEYGNSGLDATKGYVRQVLPLTNDLDLVSEKLFALKTNGGDEYCGWVINDVATDLAWSADNDNLKLIIIAGNEPFNQGPRDYKEACKKAIEKGIMINTIHCGDYEEGIRTFWKDGADCSDGKYMNINQDDKVVHIPTPFDTTLIRLNSDLNKTYIGYGSLGGSKMEAQAAQDSNAASYGAANTRERASAKASAAYKNTSWDLVDASEEDEKVLDKVDKDDLPEEMKKMTKEEQKKYVESKAKERETIQTEIKKYDALAQKYIAEQQKNNAESLTLDNVMISTLKKQATDKKFKF
jgi:hypothetical protein